MIAAAIAIIIIAAIIAAEIKRNAKQKPPTATMRCPHCGSSATVRGEWWECGWCGDSGKIK